MRGWIAGIGLLLLLGIQASIPAPATAAVAPASPAAGELEEVVVIGVRAGPRLWKISKADHVLWLLGTMDVLPKRMTWHSAQVEAALKESQELVPARMSIDADIGLIEGVRLYRQFKKIERLPDGKTLQAALTPPDYARYAALKRRYAPRKDKLETLRPMFVANQLYEAAIDVADLSTRNAVEREVTRLAKRNHVKTLKLELKISDPKNILTELGNTPLDAESQCLMAAVARLETDLPAMQQRAKAWANGDVAELRALPYPDNLTLCWQALANSGRLRELRERSEALWMSTIEGAIARNKSSFALHSIRELLTGDGVLAQLRAKGYSIEGP